MKGQLQPASKVASEIVEPTGPRLESGKDALDAKDIQELNELIVAQQQREQRRRKKDADLGKVAHLLGTKIKVTGYTFPFLTFDGNQLSVSEWFPELNIVVDKFYEELTPRMAREVAFKQKAFANNEFMGKKIQYGYLDPTMDLHDLADQIEIDLPADKK